MKFDFSLAAERSQQILESLVRNLPNYALALLALVFWLGLGIFAAGQVRRALARTGAHYGLQNLLSSLARIAFGALGVLLGLGILGIDAGAIVAGLGVAGLVFGIAFKDILENFMAGIVLLARQPFTVGDRVVTNGVEGSVTEVTLRSTILKTYDGEEVRVPNGAVLRTPITNRTAYPVSRTVVVLRMPYGGDLRRAVQVVDGAVRSVPGVRGEPGPEVAVTGFTDIGVTLEARYWTDSLGATVNRTSIQVRLSIKEALDAAGIEFAVPGRLVPRQDEPEAAGSATPGRP